MNGAVPARWIVISHQCGLDGRASSHHIDIRLPRLRECGVEPFVVTSCAAPPGAWPEQRRVPCPSFSGLRQEVRLMAASPRRGPVGRRAARCVLLPPLLPGHIVESALLRMDATWSWFLTAGPVAAACARRRRAGLVYSTSGAPSAHLAGWMCAKLAGLPWLAEFQDPVVFGEAQKRGERAFNAFVERTVARHADAVVFVTRRALEDFEQRNPLEGRGRVIYPGATPCPEPGGDAEDSGVLLIGHFGSLTMGRLPGPLLDALEHLAREDSRFRREVRFRQTGCCDGDARRQFAAFPFPEMVRVEAATSQAQSLDRMRRCSLLALIQHNGPISSLTIPSKTYEYLQTGRPVLGLTRGNPELDSLLREYGHIPADLRDAEAVRSEVRRLYDEWRRTGRLQPRPRALALTPERSCVELIETARLAASGYRFAGMETGRKAVGS